MRSRVPRGLAPAVIAIFKYGKSCSRARMSRFDGRSPGADTTDTINQERPAARHINLDGRWQLGKNQAECSATLPINVRRDRRQTVRIHEILTFGKKARSVCGVDKKVNAAAIFDPR
jgi:hypothetical protein